MRTVTAIVAAAGKSTRMGGRNKLLIPLLGVPVLRRTLLALDGHVDRIVLVAEPSDEMRALLSGLRAEAVVVPGGASRTESVRAGLDAAEGAEIVLVHDGARPLVSADVIARCVQSARAYGSGVAAVPVTDTVKRACAGIVRQTVPREELFAVQTPQTFRYALLHEAYASGRAATDDAALMEACGQEVRLVQSDKTNIKITTPEDIAIAEALLSARDARPRVGHGMDAHRLVPGRALVLGGVSLPFEAGLLGHSDADVLTHALIDALLGAAGLPDIGRQFPDTDPAYTDISSVTLLARVRELLAEVGFSTDYADVTVIAQRPKLAPHIPQMERILSETLGAPVHVKATTTEGLGYAGRGEGIAAHAVVIGKG